MSKKLQAHRIAGIALLLMTTAVPALAQINAKLIDAVKNADTVAVRTLLKQGIDVNASRSDGVTALHWAVLNNDLTLTSLLLGAGGRVEAADAYGVTALSLACTNGSGPMIKLLIGAGGDVNTPLISGETPLMTAARSGSVDAVRQLLSAKAALEVKEKSRGQTALMWAAAEGHSAVLRALLESGADSRTRSTAGYEAIHFAARTGEIEPIETLLKYGADVNAAASDGMTALVIATVRNRIALASFLLDHGANPNLGPGFTPLHWAAGSWEVGTAAVLKASLRPEDSEWTQLMGLRGEAKVRFVRKLIQHGAMVNTRAKSAPRFEPSGRGGALVGATPFLIAAMAGDDETMRLLIASGADPSIKTEQGVTPAMAAAGLLGPNGDNFISEARALGALRLAVELGNDVNAVTVNNETALHGAAKRGPVGALSIAQFLRDKGANLNVKNKRGWTPLVIAEGLFFNASNTQSTELTQLLRSFGAEPSPPNIDRDGDALVEIENSVVLPEIRKPK